MYNETCSVCTSEGTRNQYLLPEVLTIRVGLRACMRYAQGQSVEYLLSRSVLNQVLTYYQGWFMYMRYTQGQNEEYLLSCSTY